MSNYGKYEEYLLAFEKNKFNRETIVIKFIKVLCNVDNYDDYINDITEINDLLYRYGYNIQFKQDYMEKKKFIKQEFQNLVIQNTKSEEKTKEYINYLSEVSNSMLSIAMMNRIKVKYMIKLNMLPDNSEIINKYRNKSLNDLYFMNYFNDEIKEIVEKTFPQIGINYCKCIYMRFRLDMEFLLYSLIFNDPEKGYMKVNTIKVALNINPKEHFTWNGKSYYKEDITTYLCKYIKMLDLELIKAIKEKYIDEMDSIDDTGYKLLFNMI